MACKEPTQAGPDIVTLRSTILQPQLAVSMARPLADRWECVLRSHLNVGVASNAREGGLRRPNRSLLHHDRITKSLHELNHGNQFCQSLDIGTGWPTGRRSYVSGVPKSSFRLRFWGSAKGSLKGSPLLPWLKFHGSFTKITPVIVQV